MALRNKLLIVLTMLMAIMLAAVLSVRQVWRTSLREGLEAGADALLRQRGTVLGNEILDGRRMLRVLATDENLSGTNIESIRSRLRQWTQQATRFESFYYDTLEGDVYPPAGPSFSVRDREYFPKIPAGEEVTGAPIISRHTGEPVLLLTVPIRDPGGQLKGALAGTLMIKDAIVRATAGVPLGSGATMTLFDAQGRVLGSTDAGSNTELQAPSEQSSPMAFAIWRALSTAQKPAVSDAQKTSIFLDKGEVLTHFISIPEFNWYLVHAQSMKDLLAPSKRASAVSLIMLAVTFLVCVGAFPALERMVIRPIAQITDAHKKLESGDMSVRVAETGRDELADLARAFNRTVISLDKAEQKFRTIFEAFPHPIVLNRLSDGAYIDVNPAFLHMENRPREEYIGRTAAETRIETDPEASRKAKERLMAAGRIDSEPYQVVRRDGSMAWIIYSTRLIELAGEQVALSVLTDVSELKRAEEALQESEERFRSTFEQAAVGIAHVSPDGRFMRINQRFCDIVGYTPDEIVTLTFHDITYPEDLQTDLDYVRELTEGRIPTYSMEKRYIRKDGSLVWINLTVALLREPDGKPKYFLSVIEDIGKRKEAEEELEKTRALLTTAIEQSPAGILIADAPDVTIRIANPAALMVRGRTDIPLTQIDVSKHAANWRPYHPDGVTPYAPEKLPLSRAVLEGVVSTDVELIVEDDQGERRWISANAGPVRDKEGHTTAGIVIFHDITDRKQAETALRESRQQLLDIAANIPGVIYQFIARADGTMGLVYVSERSKDIFGLDCRPEDFFERFTACVADADRERFAESVRYAVAAARPWDFEGQFIKPSGESMWFSGRSIPQRRNEELIYNGVLLDITERKQAEQELRISEQRFRGVLEGLEKVAVQGYEPDGTITFWNRGSELTYGFAASSAIGRNILDVLHGPETRDAERQIIDESLRTGEVPPAGEVDVVGSDGRTVTIYASRVLAPRPGREPEFFCFDVDISEIKRSQEALRKNEATLRSVFRAAPVGICIVKDRVYQASNEHWCETVGYREDELLGRTTRMFYENDEEYERVGGELYSSLAQRGFGSAETRLWCKDGTYRDVILTAAPLRPEDLSAGTVVAIHDVTERKRAEAELKEHVLEIERFNRLAIDREQRILELKHRINELSVAAGRDLPFPAAEETKEPAPPFAETMLAETVEPTPPMPHDLADLLDLQQMQALLDAFCDAVGISAAIIDPEGKVFVGSRWQRICTDFHRTNERTCDKCIESDTILAGQLRAGQPFSFYQCRNGLTDAASPIIIEGRHVANVFVGQFLLAPADEGFFLAQAREHGFDETEYIKALRRVPVVSQDRLTGILGFLTNCASLVAAMGLDRLRDESMQARLTRRTEQLTQAVRDLRHQQEAALNLAEDAHEARAAAEQAREAIRESEAFRKRVFESSRIPIIVMDAETFKYIDCNPAAVEIYRFGSREETLGKTPADFSAAVQYDGTPSAEKARFFIAQALAEGTVAFEWRHRRPDGEFWDAEVHLMSFETGGRQLLQFTLQDITDRKRAEAALRDSQQQFHDMIDFLPDATFAIDRGGRIIAWNRAIEEMTGMAATDMLGKGNHEYALPFFGRRHPILIDFVFKAHTQEELNYLFIQKIGDTLYAESHICVVKGRLLHLSGKASPIRNAAGEIVGAIESIRDITDIKTTEQALRDSEERYRSLFEAANDAIFLVQEDRFVDCNPRTLAMFGCTREQILQAHPYDLSPERQPDGSPSAEMALQKISAAYDGEPQFFEWRHRKLDGTPFETEVSLNRVLIAGAPHLLAIVRDVTQRKRAEEELHERQEMINAIVETSQDWIWAIDTSGRHTFSNPAVERILGFRQDELVGHTNLELLHGDDLARVSSMLPQHILERRGWSNMLLRWRHKNGVYRYLESNAVPIFDPAGDLSGFRGVDRDVTERIEAEQEIRTLNAELEQRVEQRTAQLAAANTALNEFAYVVSHDLKAPLRAVSQLAQWISEDYAATLGDDGKEKISLMTGRIARMYNLIDGILQYSRIGRVEEDRKPIDLDTVVREAVESVSPPDHIRVTIQEEFPVVVADRVRMAQIFQNLIGNAIKFMDKPQGQVTVGWEDAGDGWRFRVTDNGPGIDRKYHEKVFGIFQTLTPRDQVESTGIGLALVKKIVEGYGGHVGLDSQPGKGSTFMFTLPK